MNKRYKAITVLLPLFLIAVVSCKKSFLDKEIIGVNTQSGSLDNSENARAAINASYAYVIGGDWWTHLFPRLLMEASTDDGWGGNDYQDRPGELGVCDFTGLSANTSYVDAYYRGMHQGIRNCNFIIKGLADVKTLSDDLKNRYIAEAKFLRGFFYFELVKNFGDDVINNDFNANDATLFLARSPIADVYKQIYQDFQDAAAVLPEKGQYGSSDIGRATKGAALGFLAKAYLFNGDYANAEATAAQIISSGKYSLETRYSKIFEPENANGVESLFEVNYVNAVGFYNGPEPGDVTNAASVDGGWGWFGLTSDLENAFEKEGDDVRRKATIIKAGEAVDNETPTRIYPKHLVGDKPGHTSWRYYRKYYIPLAKRVGGYGTYPFNDIKLRYAEILLIHAEAAAFNNKPAEALISLNLIRSRVGLLAKTGLPGDALKQAIWDERRLELAGEGTHRWDDIRRIKINGKALIASLMGPNGSFVKYNTTINTDPVETAGHREALNKGYYFKEGVNELWPIPASVINANSSIVQNPGY
jgi:starch-binding outer membrane protein, SusD/RagB family